MIQYDEVFEKVNNEMIPEVMKFLDNRREYLGIDDFVLAFAHVLSKLDINKREDELALEMIVRRLAILYRIANSCQVDDYTVKTKELPKVSNSDIFEETLESWENASLIDYGEKTIGDNTWDFGKHEIANKFNEETIERLLDLARLVDKDYLDMKPNKNWYSYLDEKMYKKYMELDNGDIVDLWCPKDCMGKIDKALETVVEVYSSDDIDTVITLLSSSQIFSVMNKDTVRYTSFFVNDCVNPYDIVNEINSICDRKRFTLNDLEIKYMKDYNNCYYYIWTIYVKKKG